MKPSLIVEVALRGLLVLILLAGLVGVCSQPTSTVLADSSCNLMQVTSDGNYICYGTSSWYTSWYKLTKGTPVGSNIPVSFGDGYFTVTGYIYPVTYCTLLGFWNCYTSYVFSQR
jgi:hypothetical protein